MVTDKQFTINVRLEILKKPIYKRTKKAITAIRESTARAMHTDVKHVKVCGQLNKLVWSQGKSNPPTRFKVHTTMQDEFALVELQGADFPKKKEKAKSSQDQKSLKEKIAEKLASKETQSKKAESNKELAKEQQALDKKEHAHGTQTPTGAPDPKKFKSDGIGVINQDKKKKLGEQ